MTTCVAADILHRLALTRASMEVAYGCLFGFERPGSLTQTRRKHNILLPYQGMFRWIIWPWGRLTRQLLLFPIKPVFGQCIELIKWQSSENTSHLYRSMRPLSRSNGQPLTCVGACGLSTIVVRKNTGPQYKLFIKASKK